MKTWRQMTSQERTARTSRAIANREKSRSHLNLTTALLFDAADSVEEWGRYDLGNSLRTMALDFDRVGERITATKRRLPGQPSLFLANRRREQVGRSGSFSK